MPNRGTDFIIILELIIIYLRSSYFSSIKYIETIIKLNEDITVAWLLKSIKNGIKHLFHMSSTYL